MIVVPQVDAKLEAYGHDKDAFLNVGSAVAVLAMPTVGQLQAYWQAFLGALRSELHYLWSMPHDEVVSRFGLLDYNQRAVETRGSNLWGLAPQNFVESTGLARINQAAALRAIVGAGLLTVEECGTSKFRRPEGSAAFLNGLPKTDQRRFFDELLNERCNLVEVIRLGQGKSLDLESVQCLLEQHSSAETILQHLAADAEENARIETAWSKGRAPRRYAAMWFAAYLAREGVWILPIDYASYALSTFPAWMRPIQLWLSLPPAMRKFCDSIMRDHLARKDRGNNNPLVVRVASELALASNAWHLEKLIAGPLIGYKKHCLGADAKSATHRSWAVNRLYDAELDYFKASPDQHPDSHAFVQGKRLVSKGTRPFNWVHEPHPRNVRRYERIYGSSPSSFPGWLKDWADDLERLLPLFQVEAIENKISPLEIWLLYLAGLSHPPKTFEEISRHKHINSAGAPGVYSFRDFLLQHFSSANGHAQRAMATLRQAWGLAALQNGFSHRLANPIDQTDSPFEYRGRAARTVRNALDSRVAEIIARENVRDDMVFARSLGSKVRYCWREVRSPESGELIEVFYPAAPTLIHVILHTGMRGKQARWLDTGEGDENVVDVASVTYKPNTSPSACTGRREGFLRICNVLGDSRSQVVGMWVNSGKSGPHEVPWIHDDIIQPVRELQEFQRRYYPINRPVDMAEPSFESAMKKKKGNAFPLARDPLNKLGQPLSADRLRSYWAALLKHCQPIVDREMGYHYPLIASDGLPHFDIHSLRVTIVTTLLENGVPVSVVQMLVGHKSPIMTWYYRDVSNYQVHSAIQSAFERLKRKLKEPSSLSDEDAEALESDVVTFRSDQDFVGTDLLLQHRRNSAGIEMFAHGICPGGSCEQGGERIVEGRYKPVWRPRACSGCRFRVTGPAFLNGLVHRANTLVWEIKGSIHRETELNTQIEEEEDLGRPVSHLRSTVRQEQELRDNLVNEWCLEMRTIHQAQETLRQKTAATENALITGHEIAEVRANWRETHEFELAQRLVQDAEITQANLELPADVLLYRNQVLHKIAHANSLSDYFYSLDRRTSRQAMNLFGEHLVSHTHSADQLQELIEGSLLLEDVPELHAALTASLAAPTAVEPEAKGLAA